MRSSKSRSRSKQNRSRTIGNVVNRVFDSSGPEGKVRGTPQQIIDKYNQLARDASLANDRVAAENFQQHSEHYTRLLGEAMREMEALRPQGGTPEGGWGQSSGGNAQGGNPQQGYGAQPYAPNGNGQNGNGNSGNGNGNGGYGNGNGNGGQAPRAEREPRYEGQRNDQPRDTGREQGRSDQPRETFREPRGDYARDGGRGDQTRSDQPRGEQPRSERSEQSRPERSEQARAERSEQSRPERSEQPRERGEARERPERGERFERRRGNERDDRAPRNAEAPAVVDEAPALPAFVTREPAPVRTEFQADPLPVSGEVDLVEDAPVSFEPTTLVETPEEAPKAKAARAPRKPRAPKAAEGEAVVDGAVAGETAAAEKPRTRAPRRPKAAPAE